MKRICLALLFVAVGTLTSVAAAAPATPPPERFTTSNLLPPPDGMYVSPQQFHILAAQGIVISNISHRRFTQSEPAPPPGSPPVPHTFGSLVNMEVSTDGGHTFTSVSAPAQVAVQVGPVAIAVNPDGKQVSSIQTEMLQLNISGGGLPPGVMIRESPTRQSTGQTTVRQVNGGYMISSFFDIFTELSLDNGNTWTPALQAAHVELKGDPTAVPPISTPGTLLPPPNDQYISPTLFHILLQNGVVIKDIKHRFFTQSLFPPTKANPTQLHQFNSQVDMQLSQDGGNTFRPVRAPGAVVVQVALRGNFDGNAVYDTEMLSLNIQGGDLPAGVMIRESPSKASQGGVAIQAAGDGTQRIGSFFDIWVEASLDGGQTWTPADQAARVRLDSPAAETPEATPNLPPLDGKYVSPADYHAAYAAGIVIKNVSHNRFTQNQPPPPPGGSQVHTFDSQVSMLVSTDGGGTYSPASAPAHVSVNVQSSTDDPTSNTRYFNTEMLALNIAGGTLPAGIMLRESPSKASLGRTSIRAIVSPAGPPSYEIDSFFDIFTELSLDGGATWQPSLTGPAEMGLTNGASAPVAITCPADISVNAVGPSGAPVTYAATASGGCDAAPTVVCNPPSGSTFPIGTTKVTCTASDSCGGQATCSFQVTVNQPVAAGIECFFTGPNLPPKNGLYVSPQLFHTLYANGIILRNPSHRFFTHSLPPPPLGGEQVHTFGSMVEFEASSDNGATYVKYKAPAEVSVRVTSTGGAGPLRTFDTEMLQLDISGGSLPPNVMIRESPSKASLGKTSVRQVPGGYMISSFFDIWTELSLDDGLTWVPAQQPAHVELRVDPVGVAPIPSSTPLLPPPNDAYVSPAQYHALYAQGIIIKDVRHSFFTHSEPPPPAGGQQVHTFGSQIDLQLSMDGGQTFHAMRAPAQVAVNVMNIGSSGQDGVFDTEMLQLDIQGGDLPAGVMIRESPSLPSRGAVTLDAQPDGTYRIGSFFDIFTEVSIDGGQNWLPANAPVHVELQKNALPTPFPGPTLPPPSGQYISPAQWHALYANGIIISNVSHQRFTQTQPPPPPGGSQIHSFGSVVDMMVYVNGTWTHASASANCTVQVNSTMDFNGTRFFDTEMLSLDIHGGGLPPNVMVRESPSKASLGKTSIRQDPATGQYLIDSFFDIFTELSLDGGQTWSPSVSGPASMAVAHFGPPSPFAPFVIHCPDNITVFNGGPSGAVVNYSLPPMFVFPDCPFGPFNATCVPPSGSTFPVGTTTVVCSGHDGCGEMPTCSFQVTVLQTRVPIHFVNNLLPPVGSLYTGIILSNIHYADGLIIRAPRSGSFSQSMPPPSSGSQIQAFGATFQFEHSMDGGVEFAPVSAQGQLTVQLTLTGSTGGSNTYSTEILALSLSGGTLPAGVMIRESPSKASLGRTTVRTAPGGYMIDSFFDIFTEVSLDGGQTWSPAAEPIHMEMRKDPAQVPGVTAPSPLLPPPNGVYVSPTRYHQLYAAGIIISNISHKFFTQSMPPPPPGGDQMHRFTSYVDMMLSTDGGHTYRPARARGSVEVHVSNLGSSGQDGLFDTEMTLLSISGSDLPAGVMIRESPTLPSRGGVSIQAQADGTYRIGSFFDIFPELSVDNGQSWSPASNGPAHVELVLPAPEQPFPDPNLPPPTGTYISPALYHALYANGIVLSNISHQKFLEQQHQPLPGQGETLTHTFSSDVGMQISMNGGSNFGPVIHAPANVSVSVTGADSSGNTSFFDTEMLSLDIQGGQLPAGVMVRESPSKASLGRTSVRQTPGGYQISSFFDIFTEVSTDGGANWSPAVSAPATMAATNRAAAQLSLTCPSNVTVTAANAAGAVVTYSTSVSGGCVGAAPPSVVCNPPSGSTFPVGSTTVTCVAKDACGNSAVCSFLVTVRQPTPIEVDGFPNTYAEITLSYPDGTAEVVPLAGPSTVNVYVGPGGQASDTDGDGLDDVATEMVNLDLQGTSRMGPVHVTLDPVNRSFGGIEEVANNTPGTLDVPPFTPTGSANSFFDIFAEIEVNGQIFHPAQPLHMTAVIHQKPPAPGDTYTNPFLQPVPLLDANGNPTGVYITKEVHIPDPVVEIDHFPSTTADITIQLPSGATEVVHLTGPTTVQVSIPPNGAAADTDGDGLDQVATLMTQLDLTGNSSVGPVHVTLDPTRPTRGQIQEQVNNTPGILDVPPFTATGSADSFFDVFMDIQIGSGATALFLHNGDPVHMQSVIHHKPPATNDTYINPFTIPVELLDANGNPTGIRIVKEVHIPTPGPRPEVDVMNFGLAQITLTTPGGGTEVVTLSGPATVNVATDTAGHATDTDGNGLDQVKSEMLSLDLHGSSSMGPVHVTLDPAHQSLGQIEETANNTPGILDVPPFTATGAANSFFDIFPEIQVGGQVYHPAQPIHMASVIHHKPPAPGDTYTNVFTQPIPLLDANGNPTGLYVVKEVHIPNPPVEIDKFPNTTADITVQMQNGASEIIHLTGPTTVEVTIPPNGMAADSDGNGRDDVPTVMTQLTLTGNSSVGPVSVSLDPGHPTLGKIEEQVNNTPGTLDVPPFTATGLADSFFDVFFQIQIGGMILHNSEPVHMASVIHHKPPGPGDNYVNPFTQPVELVDASGNPTGIFVVREVHTPTPGPEVDVMNFGLAQITLSVPGGGTELVTLSGPSTVNVAIDPAGHAADSDGNGLDDVATEMVNLDLTGFGPTIGPVHVTLDPAHHSFGKIEEVANNTPGTLDVPPFTATGAANSYFDVFVKIQAGGQVLHPAQPLRMQTLIHHKPPGPNDTYTNVFLQPVPLLDANGNPTGRFINREVHTPNPPVEIDQFPNTTADITVQIGPGPGASEIVHLTGPTTVQVSIPPSGAAADTDGNGLDQVATLMTQLSLTGNSSMGPVSVTLAPGQPAHGQIEEVVNNTPGILDVPPFTGTGSANSFFDVFFEIKMGGLDLFNATPVHMSSVIHHKPPAPGDNYVNPFTVPLQLVDANGNPTGIYIVREVHTPNPTNGVTCTNRITCPANIVAATCSPNGVVVTYSTPIGSNTCGAAVTVACNPPSGSTFPPGPTTVTCTATASSGSPATCTFTVTVNRDTKPPVLACPSDIVVRTCNDREIVFYTVTATDDTDPAPNVVCTPASGSAFGLGSTPVTCTATDACGNKTNCTFNVVLVAEPLPKLTITIIASPTGPLLQMCWSTPCPGYVLQCTRGLERPVQWQTITNAPTVVNGTNCVTLKFQPGRQFYRLCRPVPHEVYSPTNTIPPIGSYNSSPAEQTVFANGLIGRWFVHRIPPLPCPPNCPVIPCPTCPDPIILTFPTTIDLQYSADGGKNFANASVSNVNTRIQVHGSISSGSNGPVSYLNMEMLSMDISGGNLPPGVMVRESPTLASTGKHTIRAVDGSYRISSFFDVFLEVSLNGGQTWSAALTPIHVEYNGQLASNPYTTDTLPPAGSYYTRSNAPIRYLNGVIARNVRHLIPPPKSPKPPPCLTCPPDTDQFQATLSWEVSLDGGQTYQSQGAGIQTTVVVRHSEDTGDTRFFDTEMLAMDLISAGPGTGIMLRESPTRASLGKTTIQSQPTGGGYRIGSFFDVFTEISLDGGQTWSPSSEAIHVELNPQPFPP